MRAIIITKQGSPVADNVRLVSDWPDPPTPGPGLALVRTLASSLNHLDLWVGKGVPGLDLTYPRISGSDACGLVEAVGDNVDPSWVGRRVILNAAVRVTRSPKPEDPTDADAAPDISMIGEHTNGAMCERFLAPITNLAAIGDEHDPVEAAAFGLTFLTAWSMLVTKAKLKPGQRVLITGIGGGVALAGLAICKFLGCPVCVTSRHEWKLQRAAELGADQGVLDDGQSDWSKNVRNWSNKRGVEVALDSSGKATHLKSIKSLATGGAYVTPGCTSGPDATTDLARIFWNQLRILGSTMGTPQEFAQVARLYDTGHLSPVLDRSIAAGSTEHAQSAYARLESGEQFGKVVVEW